MRPMDGFTTMVGRQLLAIVVIIFIGLTIVPWITLWAINTLFGTALVLTFKTWLATVFLLFLVARN